MFFMSCITPARVQGLTTKVAEMDWINLAIQASGAVGVCAMFIWYLQQTKKQDIDRESKFFEQLDKQTSYLRDRDAQSKEIALNGHAALRDVAQELKALQSELKTARYKRIEP